MTGPGGFLASLFVDPVFVPSVVRSLLLLPLCLSVSIVYKTLKCASLREVPVASLLLWVTIVVGMYAVGVGMWAAFLLFS